jgi:hypothetical protein
MSYQDAKACFEDNIKNHLDPQDAPVLYNLSYGLYYLTQQLALDNRRLERRLSHLEEDLKRIQTSRRT